MPSAKLLTPLVLLILFLYSPGSNGLLQSRDTSKPGTRRISPGCLAFYPPLKERNLALAWKRVDDLRAHSNKAVYGGMHVSMKANVSHFLLCAQHDPIYIHVCIYVCIYIFVCVCTYICVCIYICI